MCIIHKYLNIQYLYEKLFMDDFEIIKKIFRFFSELEISEEFSMIILYQKRCVLLKLKPKDAKLVRCI